MLTIKPQTLTVSDFIANKEYQPFKKWRTISKTINFGLLFGCSAGRFATMLEMPGFTELDCEDYIKLTNNTQFYNTTLASSSKRMSPKETKFLVVATLMRNAFFDGYKGLQARIKREQDFALTHGYVRTWHGPVRHLSELRYMKVNSKGNLVGADRALYSKMFAHLLNNACNSTVQSMESRVAFATWHNTALYLKEWNLKSFIWNNIHDSLDFCIYKPELELVLALAGACASWERPPVKGIHMSMDFEVADIQDQAHRDNTYYKAGVGIDPIPIEEALEHWNTKYGTHYTWHGCES